MTEPAAVVELAPAKINLCLHVTGRRPDGYHELDSIVAFADLGDVITLQAGGPAAVLRVSGAGTASGTGSEPAVVPSGTGNLAWRALAVAARSAGGLEAGLSLFLEKRLPSGAGLGGGSSDAAAVLRAVARLTGTGPADPAGTVGLGADVPMCLDPRPWRARGAGERLDPVVLGRDLPALLVWPARALATPAVFAARRGGYGDPVPEAALSRLAEDPVAVLGGLRNDLTAAACEVEPVVGEALAAVAALAGCRLSRMSGSGSAVFGLFDDPAAAEAGATAMARHRPGWWARACVLRAGPVATRRQQPGSGSPLSR